MNYNEELEKMVAPQYLMNSYKLYFLKALLNNVSVEQSVFSFYELACWMVAFSFSDVCALQHRIRPLDRLYDVSIMTIELENIMESSKPIEVYETLINTNNKGLRKEVLALCNYVPYRLLAYLWMNELKGKTDKQKNFTIQEWSGSESGNIYSISTGSDDGKVIRVFRDWAVFISANRQELLLWIDSKIRGFVWKDQRI